MPNLIKKFPKLKLVLTGGGYKKRFPWLVNKNIVSKKIYIISFLMLDVCVYRLNLDQVQGLKLLKPSAWNNSNIFLKRN